MKPSHNSSFAWRIGKTRIQDATGCTGTVVYVGPVASAADPQEIYLGIVWDQASRGKHDGSVICRRTGQVVRHFKAPHATAGSFMRPHKVQTGVTLCVSLLRQRYVTLESDECVAPEGVLPHRAQTVSGRNDKLIELYGEFKIRSQQQLEDLRAVSLRRWGISSVSFAVGDDWESIHHLREVDLAGNLLSDWVDVGNLLKALPCLQTLSLASNRLGDVSEENSATKYILPRTPSLTRLNIRQSNLQSVDSLLQIGHAFENLLELSVSECPLTPSLSRSQHAAKLAGAYKRLQLLDASGTGIASCTGVLAWSQLPALESLSLDDNPGLSSWQEDDDSLNPTTDFLRLQQLQLAGTSFEDWGSLAEPLHNLPHLVRLRLRKVPLLNQHGAGQARLVTLAHLPRLQVLNGSAVTDNERKDAAVWYLRRALRQQQQQRENNAVHSNHSKKSDETGAKSSSDNDLQLEYWRALYPQLGGASSDHTNHHNDTACLMDSVLNVTIRSMAASSCTMDPLIRRLPKQLTVSRLKALLYRHYGLDMDLQVLRYTTADSAFPTELDGDENSLAYYGVPQNGAEILMDELDVEAMQREKEREVSALRSRMQEQERERDDLVQQQKRLEDGVRG